MLTIGQLWGTDWPAREIVGIDTLLSPSAPEPAPGEIAAVALSQDGRLALLDGLAEEAWVLPQPGGRWIRVAGHGEGPAELGSASGAWWVGDTLTLYDARRRRVLRLLDGMAPLGTGVPLPGTGESGFRAVPFGDSGGFLAVLAGFPDLTRGEGLQRPEVTAVWQPSGTSNPAAPDTIGNWPGRVFATLAQGGIAVLPFGADTHIDASARGIAVADGSLPSVLVLTLDGQPRTEIRWDQAPRAVSDEMQGFIQRTLEETPSAARPAIRLLIESLPVPRDLPHVGAVVMGPGEVWLAQWFGTEVEFHGRRWPSVEWRAVDIGLRPRVHRIVMPAGVLPSEILSQELVLVLLEDEVGRQGVGMVRLRLGDQTHG